MRRDERMVRSAFKELESYIKEKGYDIVLSIRLRINRDEEYTYSLEASAGSRSNSKWYQVACAMPAGKFIDYLCSWTDLFERIGYIYEPETEDGESLTVRYTKRKGRT